MQNHNDDTIKTSDTVLKKNIPLTLLKGLCVRRSWRPNRTATYWPPLLWPQPSFFPVLLGCSTGGLGAQPLWDMFSFQHLLSNCNCSIGGLRAHSAECWLSLPHLVSNWLNFLCTELYNNLTSTLPVGVTNRTHSTRPRSRLYSDAPVIYTGAFPILTARPGRRSTYNDS